MSVSFDGATKLATLSVGTTSLSVRDLWSRWVDWWLTNNNSGIAYLAMSQVGGDDIDASAGTKIPIFIFLTNGWRVKPQEASHTLSVVDGILLVDGGGDPFVNTTGNYVVRINYQQPVQAIGFDQGAVIAPTQQQIRDAMSLATVEAAAIGSIDQKIEDVSVVSVAAAASKRADTFNLVTGSVIEGDLESTYGRDQEYHQIRHDNEVIDIDYGFELGADYQPVKLNIVGRMHGTQNTAIIEAWNYRRLVPGWEQVGILAGKNSDIDAEAKLFVANTGVNSDAGKVRIRFRTISVNNDLYIDQMWVDFTPLSAFSSSDRTAVSDIKAKTDALPGSVIDGVWVAADRTLSAGTAWTVLPHGLNSSVSFSTDLPQAVSGYWVDNLCLFRTGSLAGQVKVIIGYDGGSKKITVKRGYTSAPQPGDEFILIGQ